MLFWLVVKRGDKMSKKQNWREENIFFSATWFKCTLFHVVLLDCLHNYKIKYISSLISKNFNWLKRIFLEVHLMVNSQNFFGYCLKKNNMQDMKISKTCLLQFPCFQLQHMARVIHQLTILRTGQCSKTKLPFIAWVFYLKSI